MFLHTPFYNCVQCDGWWVCCSRQDDDAESVVLDLSTSHSAGPPSLPGKDKNLCPPRRRHEQKSPGPVEYCVPLKGGKDPLQRVGGFTTAK